MHFERNHYYNKKLSGKEVFVTPISNKHLQSQKEALWNKQQKRRKEESPVFSNQQTQEGFKTSKSNIPVFELKRLSNYKLLSQTKTLVQKERKLNIFILQHLQEIELRKLYLEKGFSSLFDYAVRELGYSSGAAYRRIKAMRLCRDIPETKAQIELGKLNLSTASKLQSFFERQNEKQKRKLKKSSSVYIKDTNLSFDVSQKSLFTR